MGQIQKQGIYNTLISYTGVVIGFISAVILQPMFLSVEELGLLRFLISTSAILGIIFPFGIGNFTIKYFPAFRNNANGHNGYLRFLLLFLLLSYLFFAFLLILVKDSLIVWYDKTPEIISYLNFIFPISFCMGLIIVLNVYCTALFKSSVPAFLNDVFIRILNIVVILLFFLKLVSFNVFIILFAACYFFQLGALIIYILKIDNSIHYPVNRDAFRKTDQREMLRYTFFLGLASIASVAFRQIDVAMLGSNLSSENPLNAVAVYTIAYTIGIMVEVPASSLARIADAKMSDAITRSDRRLMEEIYFKSTRLLMVLGGLLFLGVAINIKSLLYFLPDKYQDGSYVVIIIAFSSFINMSTGMNSAIIYYSHKYIKGVILSIGFICLSVILNYFLIPEYGIEGSAIATGLSMLLFNFFRTYLIYRTFKMQPFGKYVLVVLCLLVLSFAIDFCLPTISNTLVDIIYRTIIVAGIYVFGIYFSKITPEFTSLIKNKIFIRF